MSSELKGLHSGLGRLAGAARTSVHDGNTLRDLKRLEEALASYDRTIVLKPDYAEAYSNRGNALQDQKRLEEALASYDRTITLKPNLAEEGTRLHIKIRLCDWNTFDTECAHLISSVRNGNVNTDPFAFLAVPSSSDDRLRCAKLLFLKKISSF